jgi:hypothetical protein
MYVTKRSLHAISRPASRPVSSYERHKADLAASCRYHHHEVDSIGLQSLTIARMYRYRRRNEILYKQPQAGIALGYGLSDRLFESRQGLGIFLFTAAFRPALGPTQPRIKGVPGAPSVGVKWSGREADHSPPTSAEIKKAWSYTSTPSICLGVVIS